MDLYKIRDYLGLYAPIILFILSFFLLVNKKIYLQFLIYGFILNNLLNIILKLTIKEPRPNKDKKAIEIGVVNGARIGFDKFGMPSGHAQNCGYLTSFIIMTLNNPIITMLFSLLSLISLLQRYIYYNHSILQLIVGFIIGIGIGYLTYFIGNKYIQGNIEIKKDDNGPL